MSIIELMSLGGMEVGIDDKFPHVASSVLGQIAHGLDHSWVVPGLEDADTVTKVYSILQVFKTQTRLIKTVKVIKRKAFIKKQNQKRLQNYFDMYTDLKFKIISGLKYLRNNLKQQWNDHSRKSNIYFLKFNFTLKESKDDQLKMTSRIHSNQ